MTVKANNNYEQDMVGDGLHSLQKVIESHREEEKSVWKYILIGVCVLFLTVMLVLPLAVVIINALKDGWTAYKEAVVDRYTLKALQLTLVVTVLTVLVNTIFGVCASVLLSKFYFWGRQILAALIDIPFSVSPVIAGLLFILTFGNKGWM